MRLLAAALVCAATASVGGLSDEEVDERRSKLFCSAVLMRNTKAVEIHISNGVDVNYPCPTSTGTMTALHFASRHGYTDLANHLLYWGADANVKDSRGFHALYKAAERGHGEVVRILLDVVDPLNAIRNPGGFSPLYKAAREGNIAALEILLEDGRLPLDGRTDKGITPLFAAAAEGRFACVAALLRGGANASIVDEDGWLPIDVASRNGHHEVVALLKEAFEEAEGRTPSGKFCVAVVHGDVEAVKLSIRNGVDVNYPCRSQKGTTPALHLASYYGHTNIARMLISHGANANAVDSNGFHALYAAAEGGHPDVVRLLLKKVNPFDAISSDGLSPLHTAALNRAEALNVLLEDGRLPVDILSNDGLTSLMLAARRGLLRSVEELLRHGADASIADGEGLSPLFMAVKYNHSSVVRLLLKVVDPRRSIDTRRTGFSPLHVGARMGSSAALKILLEDGRLPIDGLSENGSTPLYVAADHGQLEAARVLLSYKANASIRPYVPSTFIANGPTPAEVASLRGHHELAALLATASSESVETAASASGTEKRFASAASPETKLSPAGRASATGSKDGWREPCSEKPLSSRSTVLSARAAFPSSA